MQCYGLLRTQTATDTDVYLSALPSVGQTSNYMLMPSSQRKDEASIISHNRLRVLS
jgi:hypothetical protein